MIENDAVRYWPSEVSDIRFSDPAREIHRGIGVIRSLEALHGADLARPLPPVVGEDLVSVVVPMYNARRWIGLCLKSLLVHTHANLGSFCVDDGIDERTYYYVLKQFSYDLRLSAI